MINKTAKKENPLSKVDKEGFSISVKISSDKMLAHLIIETSEKDADIEISEDELLKILNDAGVVYGIAEDCLLKISTEVALNKPVEVARGTPPGKGKDSSFEVLFEAINTKSPVVGDDGFIDYKNLNLIKNATKDQPLAKKIPASAGEPGMTVTGEEILGKTGKDKALPKGKNTELSPDNPDLLIATKNGSITYTSKLISVEDVYTISSDVDTSTGNVDFIGSLKITGAVKAGFKVRAEGNIEIGKNIEDAQVISSGGSVLATGGCVGSGKGWINAAEDVFVKYIENENIEAGHDVNIGGSAMNANINAGNSVILNGNKAVIVGGSITASSLVEAGCIGSEFGTKTLVRVGYNPKLMKELSEVDNETNRLEADSERIKKALYSLVRLELDNKLGDSQKNAMNQLKNHQKGIPDQIKKLNERKSEVLTKLNENKKAKIIVRQQVYPGAIIQIGTLRKEIEKVVSNCTFRISHDKVAFFSNY